MVAKDFFLSEFEEIFGVSCPMNEFLERRVFGVIEVSEGVGQNAE